MFCAFSSKTTAAHIKVVCSTPFSLIVCCISSLSLVVFLTCTALSRARSFPTLLTNFSLLFTYEWLIFASPSSEASIFPGTVQAHSEMRFYRCFLCVREMVSGRSDTVLFPGLILRPDNSPIVLLIFKSSRIVVTGARTYDDIVGILFFYCLHPL